MSNYKLQTCEKSPSETDAVLTVNDFLTMNDSAGIDAKFKFNGYNCCITVKNKEPSCVSVSVLCHCSSASASRVYCALALKSRDGTIYKIPVKEGDCHVTWEFTTLFAEIPWSEFDDRTEWLAPEGVLTLICKLSISREIVAAGGSLTVKDCPRNTTKGASSTTSKTCDGSKESHSHTKGVPNEHRNSGNESNTNMTFQTVELSSTAVEAIWTVRDFFTSGERSWVTPKFELGEFDCNVSLSNEEPYYVCFGVLCHCFDASDPRVFCQLAMKPKEGPLYGIQIHEHKRHVTKDGTILSSEIPWTEFEDKRESLAPEGAVTVVCKLSTREIQEPVVAGGEASSIKGTFTKVLSKIGSKMADGLTATGMPDKNRNPGSTSGALARSNITPFGKIKTRTDFPSRVEITWTIENFFNLPCDMITGVTSKQFDIPGGRCFIGLHPYGTSRKRGFVQFSIAVVCPEHEGIRNPEVDCELTALKGDDDALYKNLRGEDDELMGSAACVFYRYFRLSDIVDKNKSLVPDGVLTVLITLCSHKFASEGASSAPMEDESAAADVETKEDASIVSESCDGDFEQVLTRLSVSGEDKNVTIRVGGKEFRTYMSILLVRTPIFASELHKRMRDDAEGTRTVDIDDLCGLGAFRAFMEFVNTGKVQYLSTDTAFELYVLADRFKMDELKEMCEKYSKTSQAKFMIFNA